MRGMCSFMGWPEAWLWDYGWLRVDVRMSELTSRPSEWIGLDAIGCDDL